MTIKYFDGQVLLPDSELLPEEAENRQYFNKVYIQNDLPVYSESYSNSIISNVVYFDRDPKDEKLKNTHIEKYGKVRFQICNCWKENNLFLQQRYYYSEEAQLKSYVLMRGEQNWNWDDEEIFGPEGEKWESIKYIYDKEGEIIKEKHFKPDGTLWFEFDKDDPY